MFFYWFRAAFSPINIRVICTGLHKITDVSLVQSSVYQALMTSLIETVSLVQASVYQVLMTSLIETLMFMRASYIDKDWCHLLVPKLSMETTDYVIKQLCTTDSLISSTGYKYFWWISFYIQ